MHRSVPSLLGKKIVFTSTRNGDIDIYTMNADGSNVKQLTHELGYDGGPFWSYDGKKIVYRAEHPKTPGEITDYKQLLAEGKISPVDLDLVCLTDDVEEAVRHIVEADKALAAERQSVEENAEAAGRE